MMIVIQIVIAAALVLLSSILVMNRTSIFIMIPVLIFLLFPKLLQFTKVFNILTYTGIGLFFNLIFVVFRKQSIFSWLIVGIMHREISLTHRTEVWDAALSAIQKKPILGHGYQTFVFSPIIETTHNEFIEMLYKTGIVGLILFLLLLVVVIILLFKHRKAAMTRLIALFVGAFFLLFTVEQ